MHLEGCRLSGLDLSGRDLRRVDFSGADLSSATLIKSNLRSTLLNDANLSSATLRGSDLHGARLVEARMQEVSVTDSDLSETDLRRSNMRGARLDFVSLRSASLINTNLHGASLRGADLSMATFYGTILTSCDLSQVRGLDTVNHMGPSSIGVDTLALTLEGAGGQFTSSQRTFLEAAGVPKTLLDYLPSLLESQPIQFFSCFISYGGDEKFADRLYHDLKENGLSCWKYDEDALVGRGVWANIDRAIRLHGKTILICSQFSLQRPGVQREIERALQREDELKREQAAQPDAQFDTDVLFPVRLDDFILERWEHPRKPDVVAKHIGDFRGWDEDDKNYQRGLGQLLHALDPRSEPGRPRPPILSS